MNVSIIFWLITLFLTLLALLVVIPGLHKRSHQVFFSVFLVAAIYVFYLNFGGGRNLKEYYSEQQIASRMMQEKMRPLFAEMKKQQTRLRLTLLENPNDLWSKALLLEILGVEALYHEEKALANQYWDAALELLASLEKNRRGDYKSSGIKVSNIIGINDLNSNDINDSNNRDINDSNNRDINDSSNRNINNSSNRNINNSSKTKNINIEQVKTRILGLKKHVTPS